MHGVKRVPESERDHAKEALKKEKAQKYRALSAEVKSLKKMDNASHEWCSLRCGCLSDLDFALQIVRRRRDLVLDAQTMALTTKVLEINPEFHTVMSPARDGHSFL
jgi:hypothetical protein